jgi:hypothetical protein
MSEILYNVVVDYGTDYANDCGEMTETQLLGYLSNRPLLGRSPQEVLGELEQKGGLMVEFGNMEGKSSLVRISRVSTASG